MSEYIDREKFKPGDIIRNHSMSEDNPYRDAMYIKTETKVNGIHKDKLVVCICYNGRKRKTFSDAPLEKVGHLAEFDALKDALKRLAGAPEESEE